MAMYSMNSHMHVTTQSDRSKVSANKCLHFGLPNAQYIGNKSITVASRVDEERIDVLLLTETWSTSCDDMALYCCVPPGLHR